MKRLFLLFLVPVLLVMTACQREIPIADIIVDPSSKNLFVGESFDLTIQYLPEDATNSDDIQVYSTNESIVTYDNGKVTAKDGGTAAITASCGNVLGQCRVKVYKYSLYKGGKYYGVDSVKGYGSKMGEDGIPSVKLADWTSTDATLTRGILHVEQVHSNHFKIKADFELSNGYRFGTDWEGDVSLEIE